MYYLSKILFLVSKYYVLAIFIMEKEGVKLFILERGELIAFDAILDISIHVENVDVLNT